MPKKPAVPPTDLTQVPVEELQAELLRRENAKRNDELQALAFRQHIIANNIDTLLALAPVHDCTSCSDEEPSNFSLSRAPRCRRCQLLYIQREKGCLYTDVSLDVHYRGLEQSEVTDVQYT